MKIHGREKEGRSTARVADGRLLVSSTAGVQLKDSLSSLDFRIAASLGLVPGVSIVSKVGENRLVGAATTPETIWGGGGLYPWQSATYSLEAISDNVADDGAPGGTGMRTILIEGLDANWVEQEEAVILNGTTAVVVPGTWRRVNNVTGLTSGSTKSNTGTITVRLAGAGASQSVMLPGDGHASQLVFTIPLGKTAAAMQFTLSIVPAAGATQSSLIFKVRRNDDPDRPFVSRFHEGLANNGSTSISVQQSVPELIPEMTDIDVICDGTSADAALAGFFGFYLFDNSELS